MRARDEDRNLVVETLQAAFVDGQLDADERETRVGAALSAKTIQDLRRLVADLQAPPTLPVAAATPLRLFTPPSDARNQKAGEAAVKQVLRRLALTGAALVGVSAVGSGIASVVSSDDDTAGSSHSVGEDAEQIAAAEAALADVVMWSEVRAELRSGGELAEGSSVAVPALGAWEITPEKLKDAISMFEDAFGAPYVRELELWDSRVSAKRALRGTRVRLEDWSYYSDSGLMFHRSETVAGRDLELLDLRDVDVDALFRNAAHGIETLGMEDARINWIDIEISSTDEVPEVSIWFTNRFEESAWLETTLDGRIIAEHPFTG